MGAYLCRLSRILTRNAGTRLPVHGGTPPPRLRPQHARGTCSGHPTATFQKSPVFFNTFDLPRTRRAMHLRCSHSLTPNFRGCCGASPLASRARRNFFAHGPPFYTQLADWPRAHMGPVGFSRGGNGALDRGPLCEGVLGHPRPAQPTVGPSAVVVGHPFVLPRPGFVCGRDVEHPALGEL